MSEALERAIARLRRRSLVPEEAPLTQLSDAAFRAAVVERLRALERQLDEVRGRVNGLLFLLAGAVAAELVLRILG